MSNNTLPILVNEIETTGQSSMFPSVKKTISKVSDIQVDIIQENIKEVIEKTIHLFDDLESNNSKLYIDTVALNISISNGGKVSIIGEANANLNSGITITFKKNIKNV